MPPLKKYIIPFIALLYMQFAQVGCEKKETFVPVFKDTIQVVQPQVNYRNDTGFVSVGKLNIYFTKTAPCYPNQETFYFGSNINELIPNANCYWYFADGEMYNGQKATHQYDYTGSYVVKLIVYDAAGNVPYSVAVPLKAWGKTIRPVASFYTQYDFESNLRYITFNATSSLNKGSIVKYVWDYGDKTVDTLAVSLTRHQFPENSSDKNYPVKLTIFSDAGCSADTTIYVWVPATYPISGAFDASVQHACTNEQFVFTAQASNVPGAAEYRWDFSDGAGVKTGNPVKYAFKYMNDYDVKMSIYLDGRLIYKANKMVSAKGQNPKPKASFYTTLVAQNNTSATWSVNSTSTIAHGGIDGYYWSFGNGVVNNDYYSFLENTYSKTTVDKTYSVRLIVTGNGCADTAYNTIAVGKIQ